MPCRRGELVDATDGLPARCVGRWSGDKLYYVRRYLDLFSRSMRDTFPVRHYVDLFAGPGLCRFDDDSGETDGSPLLALQVPYPFTKYHFVDTDNAAVEALKTRIQQRGIIADVAYYLSDANQAVDQLRGSIPPVGLSVVVADPTGLHLRFEALSRLVSGRRMDLIYLFPEGMAAKRNMDKFLLQDTSALDEVLGTRAWRNRVPGGGIPDEVVSGDPITWEVGRPIVDLLRRQLGTLGYQEVSIGSEVLISSWKKNVPLYYLVFASKSALGHKFWNAIRTIGPDGQLELPVLDIP